MRVAVGTVAGQVRLVSKVQQSAGSVVALTASATDVCEKRESGEQRSVGTRGRESATAS